MKTETEKAKEGNKDNGKRGNGGEELAREKLRRRRREKLRQGAEEKTESGKETEREGGKDKNFIILQMKF